MYKLWTIARQGASTDVTDPFTPTPLSTPTAPSRGGLRGAVVRLLGASTFTSARSVYRLATRAERRADFPVGFKLWAWRHGFRASSAALHDRAALEAGEYVTDYALDHRCAGINPIRAVFDNKLLLRRALAECGVRQPETVAFASRHGVVLDPLGTARYVDPAALAAELVRRGGRYIFKPEHGSHGDGIHLVEVRDGALVSRRGDKAVPFRVPAAPERPRLLERAVEQHAFWHALSPHSVNTIRILTLWTPGDPEPFLARAVQRIGTRATLPTDNWSGGGIAARVDLETGELGMGRANPFTSSRQDVPYPEHPETGARVAGAVLPGWRAIADATLAAARCLPYAPYIGWDIAVDGDGTPVIIEGNHNTGVNLLQAHGGLLADPAIRRFYQTCGIV